MILPERLVNRLDATVTPAPQDAERGYSATKGAWIPMRQEVRNAKKQSRTGRSNSVIRLEPGLLNLDQVLIAQGILTQTSDRQAVAMALGLADRKSAAGSIFEEPRSR
jgi:hypothetical protein